ncbi:MAG: hypothetical protein ACREQ5_08660, partial [Candidatus Dormibacteria bacterium]
HLVYDRKVEVPQHVMDVIQTWMAKCSLGHGHGRPEGEHLPENEKQGTIETTGLITVVQQL